MSDAYDTNTMNKANAGFFVRLLAIFVETFLISVPMLLGIYYFLNALEKNSTTDPLLHLANLVTFLIVGAFLATVIVFVYKLYFTVNFGGPIGKLLCGIAVKNAETNQNLDYKTAIYRELPGYAFSSAFWGLGFLRVLKNENNLAWHDELFKTKVVQVNSYVPGIAAFLFLLVAVVLLLSANYNIYTSISIF